MSLRSDSYPGSRAANCIESVPDRSDVLFAFAKALLLMFVCMSSLHKSRRRLRKADRKE